MNSAQLEQVVCFCVFIGTFFLKFFNKRKKLENEFFSFFFFFIFIMNVKKIYLQSIGGGADDEINHMNEHH